MIQYEEVDHVAFQNVYYFFQAMLYLCTHRRPQGGTEKGELLPSYFLCTFIYKYINLV